MEVITMAKVKSVTTHAEKIPPELLPDKESLNRIKQIKKQLEKNTEAMKSLFSFTLKLYYELGEIILPWSQNFRGRITVQIVEATFGIPMKKINTGLKIYKYFVTNPELMESLSISEAIKMIDFREKAEQQEREKITYQSNDGQQEFSWEDLFEIPPVAKVKLERFRLTCPNSHELFLVEKGQNYPVKVIEFYTGEPDSTSLKLAHQEMLKNVQASIEQYYAQYEKEVTL